MNDEPPLDLVTGAFSYSGSHIAERLLASGHRVRTLTFHADRAHPLQDSVEALAYRCATMLWCAHRQTLV